MAFLVRENTRFQPNLAPLIEHNRPMLLKDFLRDDGASHSCKSSSSRSTVAVSSKSLLRSWSKRAAATKMSAVHKVIKLLQFASSKSPSVLPRSISRKLTKRSEGNNDIFGDVSEVKVKVKDILRWRSFRDLVDDDPTPLDFPPSPDRRIAAAAAATTTSCSKRSSWCDSDFTAEESPPWGGENEEFWGKNAATLKNPKGDWSFEEYEQQSPVSVLDSPFRQVEEFISPYHPTLANVQREKRSLTRRTEEHNLEREIGICNATEEKAKQLVRHLKAEDDKDDSMILDFFIHELGKFNDDEYDCKILRIAKSWMNGDFEESYEWDVEEKRESFVKDMEEGICWNKFKQEQQELCHQLELTLFNDLIDHLVADLILAT